MTNGIKPKTLGELADDSVAEANRIMEEREAELIRSTSIELEEFRPVMSDSESFNKLIEAVSDATKKNESIAELKDRIVGLGDGVLKVTAQIVAIISRKLPK